MSPNHFPKSPHSLRFRFPSSPLPSVITSLSPPPFVTASLRHHFPLKHFPRSPLPSVIILRYNPSLPSIATLRQMYCCVMYCCVMYCYVVYCYVMYCCVMYYYVMYCYVMYCRVMYCDVYCYVLYCHHFTTLRQMYCCVM